MKTIPGWFWNKLPIAKVDLLTMWTYSQNSGLLEFFFYPIDLRLLQRYPLIKICEKQWKQRANWACSMSAANLNLSFVWDLSVCDESRLTTEDLKGCVFKNVSGKVNRQENYQRQKSYLEQIHQNDVYVQLKLRTNEKQCFLQSQYISWAMFSRRSITIVLSVIALQS